MPRLLILASLLLGGGSLLGLGVFLFVGSLELVPLRLPLAGLLALDAALCLFFFLQHSGMVRQGFRRRLAAVVPEPYQPALYSASSGVALLLVIVLWQRSDVVVWSLSGPWRWLPAAACLAALLLGWWGVRALGSFDALGIASARTAQRGVAPAPSVPLTARGPYRLVRHPLYTAALVFLWAHPHVTLDRMLFAVLWSGWVVVSTRWEERDLVARFGEPYRRYQDAVPMLLPWRRPRLNPEVIP